MLIYRIEDVDGGGMYRGDNSYANPVASSNSDRHPLPNDDSLLMDNISFRMDQDVDPCDRHQHWTYFLEDEFIFGFASVEQMRNWVYNDDWLVSLDHVGFNLTVYDVPENHICIGNTQAVFRRHEATSNRRYTMAQFFNL